MIVLDNSLININIDLSILFVHVHDVDICTLFMPMGKCYSSQYDIKLCSITEQRASFALF